MAPLTGSRLERFLRSELNSPETDAAVSWVGREFGGLLASSRGNLTRALAAVRLGASPEEVARFLDWKEFELFCAALLRARGFLVEENITMTKPRAQVDLLARSDSVALAVDCKHWSKTMGQGALSRVVGAQAKRAKLLRQRMGHVEPMVVDVLLMSNEPARYEDGGAVVPIYALRDFLDNFPAYSGELTRY